MMDYNLIQNAVGTAYNVLLEQNHPDADQLGKLLPELMKEFGGVGSAFDLRFRHFNGEPLVKTDSA